MKKEWSDTIVNILLLTIPVGIVVTLLFSDVDFQAVLAVLVVVGCVAAAVAKVYGR